MTPPPSLPLLPTTASMSDMNSTSSSAFGHVVRLKPRSRSTRTFVTDSTIFSTSTQVVVDGSPQLLTVRHPSPPRHTSAMETMMERTSPPATPFTPAAATTDEWMFPLDECAFRPVCCTPSPVESSSEAELALLPCTPMSLSPQDSVESGICCDGCFFPIAFDGKTLPPFMPTLDDDADDRGEQTKRFVLKPRLSKLSAATRSTPFFS